MDAPFSRWYCDCCGHPIEKVEDGYVIWTQDDQMRGKGFKIIHQTKCDDRTMSSSAALGEFLGPDGLAKLLSMISYGPIIDNRISGRAAGVSNLSEFVDLIRRLQTPHYEEARRQFANPDLVESYSDANQVLPYLQHELQAIIKSYPERR